MIILIQEEWDADDIISYCKDTWRAYSIMTKNDISKMDINKFFRGPAFCDTNIIQKNLSLRKLDHLIPDTYPLIFNDFYHRSINKSSYKNIDKFSFPYFIKSIGNNKLVDGTIIHNEKELNELWINNNILPTDDTDFYISNVVEFATEYRIFIGNNHIYGVGHQKGNNMMQPDYNFIINLTKMTNGKFYCIDIGYIKDKNKWAVVEVNPPFALDDYGILIDDYMLYTIDFWKSFQ